MTLTLVCVVADDWYCAVG